MNSPLVLAHLGHWVWQLLAFAPLLLIAALLVLANFKERREPERYERETEEDAERRLDEILKS